MISRIRRCWDDLVKTFWERTIIPRTKGSPQNEKTVKHFEHCFTVFDFESINLVSYYRFGGSFSSLVIATKKQVHSYLLFCGYLYCLGISRLIL